MSGPLLIYIYDLPHAVQNSVASIYADDTSLCYQASDIETLNEAINNDLIQLETWLKGNKLSLNLAKTNSMLISIKQKHKILKSRDEDLKLKIRNKELEVIQKNKIPWCGDRQFSNLEGTHRNSFYQSFQGYWLSKAFKNVSTTGNT